MGYRRVKRERSQFHSRVFDGYQELRTAFTYSLLIGAILSLVTVVTGVTVSPGILVLAGILFLLLSLTLQYQLLSPAYVLGGALVLASFLPVFIQEIPLLRYSIEFNNQLALSFLILLGLLLVVEGFLIMKNGNQFTSPLLTQSKRGRTIGVQEIDRLWLLPLILFVPGELAAPWEWWPVLPIGQEGFTPIILPIPLGYRRRFQGMLTSEGTKLEGKYVLYLGVLIGAASFLSLYGMVYSYLVIGAAIIGREAIAWFIRHRDQTKSSLYTARNQGLVVMGIHPLSPAEKMGVQVGETITKINGESIRTPDEFYYHLQKNRSYCKLEILNFEGEIRFAQRALYEGEHHELGLLFVDDVTEPQIAVV